MSPIAIQAAHHHQVLMIYKLCIRSETPPLLKLWQWNQGNGQQNFKDTASIEKLKNDQNYSQEMPKLSYSQKQVEKYSLCIYEVIYNQKQVNQVANNTEEIEIIQAGTLFRTKVLKDYYFQSTMYISMYKAFSLIF